MKKEEKKKKTIVYEYGLSKSEIKAFEQEHPGYRLPFDCRHPKLPIYISVLSIVWSIVALIVSTLIRIIL